MPQPPKPHPNVPSREGLKSEVLGLHHVALSLKHGTTQSTQNDKANDKKKKIFKKTSKD